MMQRRGAAWTRGVAVTAAAAIPLLAGSALSGCGVEQLAHQRLLVWHDWPEPESAVLTELLSSYEDLDPDLDLIVEYVPADQIEARFTTEVQSGFGPDLLIGADAGDLAGLVAQDAVHRISSAEVAEHDFGQLDERAMASMAVDGVQRGIPLTGFTPVLYYREGVMPPRTLDQIVELAEDGHTTAIPLDFFRAYWGVDAFGGSVFAPDGEVAPDQGFADWMAWLAEARPQPNVILDGEYEMLRDLFAAGEIDVFVGGSRELGNFRTILQGADDTPPEQGVVRSGDLPIPDDTVPDDTEPATPAIDVASPTLTNIGDLTFGVTTLPRGSNEAPGGLLDVEGMIVNEHTDSLDGTLDLMEYLTNVPSQGRIARSGVGRIPINGAVSIDPTISPIEAALVAQQERAAVLPDGIQDERTALREVANDVYLQVTRGLLDPDEAATALTDEFDEAKDANDE
jgi:ABC-type glycerol-3-phosphate transport system substrate-binding protein